jgi:tetratricopeptide (TPR) repeat protein
MGHIGKHRGGPGHTSADGAPGEQDPLLERVMRMAAGGKYQNAIDLLRAQGGRDEHLRNALGVCLLRLGRVEEAIGLYRELVLKPGCTWARPELPAHYKTNYAAALLLGGHVAGCRDVLADLGDDQNRTVQNLRAAIRQWESGLSLWQRLNWKLGGIVPAGRPVTISFEPGDFGTDLGQPKPTGTNRTPGDNQAA